MSIENDLNRIANALERIAATKMVETAITTGAEARTTVDQALETLGTVVNTAKKVGRPAKTEKPAPMPEAPVAPVITKDDVTDALREFVRVKGQAPALAILQKSGAGRISEIKEDKYAELLADLKAGLR